ncbi:hypothetical protein OROMI_021540 [Orobanche minor]
MNGFNANLFRIMCYFIWYFRNKVLSMQTMVGWPKCFDPSLGSKLWILPPAVSRRAVGGTVTYVTNEFIEMRSDTSLEEAVKLLARHKVSAPVLDVNAPEDASWIDRYIGVVEFAGIVVCILHQMMRITFCYVENASAFLIMLRFGYKFLSENMEGGSLFDLAMMSGGGGGSGDDIGPAVAAAAASGMSSPSGRYIRNFSVAPFLALQKANFFLTMLLLLSKYKMKSVQVVDLGEAKIDNVITQSAVIHMLEECAGLHLFESWGSKKLFELGLPLMKSTHIIKRPDWLVGRQGSLLAYENTLAIPQTSADDLSANITRDLESQMEAKVNRSKRT